jgi:hypothetical protein
MNRRFMSISPGRPGMAQVGEAAPVPVDFRLVVCVVFNGGTSHASFNTLSAFP